MRSAGRPRIFPETQRSSFSSVRRDEDRGVVVGAAGMKPVPRRHARSADSLLEAVDATRRDAAQRLDPRRRVLMGQHLTPASVARDLFAAGKTNDSTAPS